MSSHHTVQANGLGLSSSDSSQVVVRPDDECTYNQIVYLRVPPRRLIHPHTVLFEPNPIDLWLSFNKFDAYRNVFFTGFLLVSDVPWDQVLCNVTLRVTEVRWYISKNISLSYPIVV
jgi:hypothetical protein